MVNTLLSFQIATIVHSRQARVKFDPLWLDLGEKVILETEADKITPLVVNPGRLLLSSQRLFFQPYNNVEPVSCQIKAISSYLITLLLGSSDYNGLKCHQTISKKKISSSAYCEFTNNVLLGFYRKL